jgi:predicted nuclease of predicted toxin-antitoxin system
MAIATAEQRVLLTKDKDFDELNFRRHLPHAGVILFQLAHNDLEIKRHWLYQGLNHYLTSVRTSSRLEIKLLQLSTQTGQTQLAVDPIIVTPGHSR